MTFSAPQVVLPTQAFEGKISPEMIQQLRRSIFVDGTVTRVELGALFQLDAARTEHDDAWSDLFCDAVLQNALQDTPPQGYLSDENARFLISAIGEKKDARTDTALEALTRIIEKASQVPAFFSAFVLRQIKNAAIYADGPNIRGRRFSSGCIGEVELDFVRRVLWGAGSEGLLAVSQEEAEALFDIADATTGNANDPAWEDFFARAIGNYLLGATGRAVPTREQALQLWHTDHKSMYRNLDVVDVLGKTFTHIANRNFRGATLQEDIEAGMAEANLAREKAIVQASHFEGAKADWLVDRIMRNGVVTGPEAALLSFVQREAASLAGEVAALMPAGSTGGAASIEDSDNDQPRQVTFGRKR